MAKYYQSGFYSKKNLGMELEDELVNVTSLYFSKKGDKGFQPAVGTKADKEQGTDAYIWGVPCDFTCNFAGKDHMTVLQKDVPIGHGISVKFGVRTGNSYKGYKKFNTPVLVIGIDGADTSVLNRWLENITSLFASKIGDIIDVGQTQYWDWCDENGVE